MLAAAVPPNTAAHGLAFKQDGWWDAGTALEQGQAGVRQQRSSKDSAGKPCGLWLKYTWLASKIRTLWPECDNSTDDSAMVSLQSVQAIACNNIHASRYEDAEGLCHDYVFSRCLLQVMLSHGDPIALQKLGQAMNASLAKAANRPLQSLSSNTHQVLPCICKQADLLLWCVLPWYAAWQVISR